MGFFSRNVPKSIVPEAWEFYTYIYGDEQRAMIRFALDFTKDSRPSAYAHGRRVIMYADPEHVLHNGLPDREEYGVLNGLEEGLIDRLTRHNIDCQLVGIMTYNGLRDLIFQVREPKKFDQCTTQWIESQLIHRFDQLSYAGWDFFDRKVSPAPEFWQQIQDRQVIDALLRAGSDPTSPHVLEHHFIGPAEALKELRGHLEADGFQMIGQVDDQSMTISSTSELDLERISSLTWRLRCTCNKLGVSYDGWGAEVVRPQKRVKHSI